ncbi:hypothetical protein, partial [Hyalangium sp.]|uniref:hypothetical protein n=1 Tax=Hyalangium sp. TaxID=2028555 RepID=UPI002D376020
MLADEGGLVHADKLAEQRQQSLESKILNLEEIISGQRSVSTHAALARTEEMVKGKSRREVVGIWLATANQLDGASIAAEVRATAHTRLGFAQWNVGDIAVAQASFDRAYEISPTSRDVKIGRAIALAMREQFSEAEALLAAELGGENSLQIAGVFAQILLYKGDYEALDRLAKQHSLEGSSGAMLRRVYATSLVRRQRAAEAVQLLTQHGAPGPEGEDALLLGTAIVASLTARAMRGNDPVTFSVELEQAET